jgi:hypothetical protein
MKIDFPNTIWMIYKIKIDEYGNSNHNFNVGTESESNKIELSFTSNPIDLPISKHWFLEFVEIHSISPVSGCNSISYIYDDPSPNEKCVDLTPNRNTIITCNESGFDFYHTITTFNQTPFLGTIIPSFNTIEWKNGSDAIYQFIPNSGFELDYLLLDNVRVNPTDSFYYNIKNITKNHILEASFRNVLPTSYNVFIEKDENSSGDGNIPENTLVQNNTMYNLWLLPTTGSLVSYVGVSKDGGTTYENVTENIINNYTTILITSDTHIKIKYDIDENVLNGLSVMVNSGMYNLFDYFDIVADGIEITEMNPIIKLPNNTNRYFNIEFTRNDTLFQPINTDKPSIIIYKGLPKLGYMLSFDCKNLFTASPGTSFCYSVDKTESNIGWLISMYCFVNGDDTPKPSNCQ